MRKQRSVVAHTIAATALFTMAVLAMADTGKEESSAPDTQLSVASAGPPPESVPPGRSGMRVFLDPQTGLMRARPTAEEGVELRARRGERFSTYGGDLIQERLPKGGFRVDLRGRFQSAVVATIDPVTEEVTIDCVSEVADEGVGDDR